MAPGREGGASGQGLPRSSRMERPGDPHQTRGRQEQKASRRKEKGGQGSSERPTPPLRVRTGRQALRRSGAGTRGVRAAPARGGCRQRAEHRPGPPPGKPGAEKPCGSGARGGSYPAPPLRARSQRSWLQGGLGAWPRRGAEALGPGEAAHLTVASARLVHEGAVLTGPHGGRGGVRGAPHGTVLLEARKLHSDCACRAGREDSAVTSAPPGSACQGERAGQTQLGNPHYAAPADTQNPAK